jgi:hypothetical protein
MLLVGRCRVGYVDPIWVYHFRNTLVVVVVDSVTLEFLHDYRLFTLLAFLRVSLWSVFLT